MLNNRTPMSLLDQQALVFRTQLDGVYDGAVAAVHDARVATRRIRELLALLPPVPGRRGDKDTASCYKEIGRALGKVRDKDAQIALISSLEPRAPQAAPLLMTVRRDYERERLAGMRRLIKTLERMNVDGLLRVMDAAHPAGVRQQLGSNGWRLQLKHLVVARAHCAVEAISHATGVYFPKRAHSARIAIKRVRYASEIAAATGLAALQPAIKTLRKGQEILGDLHDRQSLADILEGHARLDGNEGMHATVTRQLLDGEMMQLHAAYLARREALREACAEVEYLVSRAWRPGPAIAVGAALAGSVILASRHALVGHVKP